jgi:hypothetical protein
VTCGGVRRDEEVQLEQAGKVLHQVYGDGAR